MPRGPPRSPSESSRGNRRSLQLLAKSPSSLLKRLVEVGEDIVDMLNSDR